MDSHDGQEFAGNSMFLTVRVGTVQSSHKLPAACPTPTILWQTAALVRSSFGPARIRCGIFIYIDNLPFLCD